jgi:hypothetical protein
LPKCACTGTLMAAGCNAPNVERVDTHCVQRIEASTANSRGSRWLRW